MAETEEAGVMSLTVSLLSAYFANNTVPSSELPALVEETRRALLGGAAAIAAAPEGKAEEGALEIPAPEPDFKPAVTVESLASPNHLLSLIDGKPYKALKRHLSSHGLTPAEYRGRYGLSADYPMVAPGYSAARREVAIRLGLGGKSKRVPPSPAPAPEAASESEAPSAGAVEAAEPVVVEAKPASVRRVRGKAATSEAAAVPAKNAKRKAANREAKPDAAKGAPKPKRSRPSKAADGAATPSDAAPVEAPAAG
jgi:predicted transcriptional regulator